ncbi:MAG TPA: hypothetical protein DCK76_05100 [Desulfotomaculum sp.]|nr:MAG: Uncharacterized protein XD84_1098 [Desulfotomaculum sp. 46_80]HAG10757.1 hypothetical protein [Desulfotomaculum sp.]
MLSTVLCVSAKTNQINDGTIYIDSSLPEKDKAIMKDIMEHLDKEDRENVLYIALDGSYYANKASLLAEFKKQNEGKFDATGKLKLLTNEIPLIDEGNINSITKPDVTTLTEETGLTATSSGYQHPSSQCTNNNSGPYRKVLSKSGYSRLIANIYLPAKPNEAVMTPSATSGDKGYIYTGAVTSGGQIDMGLALNYEAGPAPTNETWGMFVTGASSVITPDYGNYKMGTSVYMKYYTPQNNQAALYCSGYDKAGNPSIHTLVVAVSTSLNFKTSGVGMQIKRITSIGQIKNHQDLTTGSFIKNVGWSNVKIGTTSGSEVLMNSSNTSSMCGYKTSNVLVDYTNQANEKVWVKCGNL